MDYDYLESSVQAQLLKKNLWTLISTEVQPEDPEQLQAWKNAQEKATGIIMENLDFCVWKKLSEEDRKLKALKLLAKIKELAKEHLGERKRQANAELTAAKFKEGDDIKVFVNNLERLHQILVQCNAGVSDEDKSRQLQAMLPSGQKYSPLKSNITSMIIHSDSYQIICKLVVEEITRLQQEEHDRPQVLVAQAPSNNHRQHDRNQREYRSSNRLQERPRYNNRQQTKPYSRNHHHDRDNRNFDRPGQFNNRHNYNRDQRKYSINNRHGNWRESGADIKCGWCRRYNHTEQNCWIKQDYDKKKRLQPINLSVNLNDDHDDEEEASANIVQANVSNVTPNRFSLNNPEYLLFILDSGASHHLIGSEQLAEKFYTLARPIKINIADKGNTILATKKGDLHVRTELGYEIVLKDVLFSKETNLSIISFNRLRKMGLSIFAWPFESQIYMNDLLVSDIDDRGTLLFLHWSIISNPSIFTAKADRNNCNFNLWHQRLGHPSNDKFNQIIKYKLFKDTEIISGLKADKTLCEPCIMAKQTRLPTNKIKDKSDIDNRPLLRIHSDVCTVNPTAMFGYNHFVTFIDDYTHYCVTYLLETKDQVFIMMRDFVEKAHVHFIKEGYRIKHLYCDNGGEYLSKQMKEYMSIQGISYHLTCPHTSSQNGVSERMNRNVLDKTRALLKTAGLGNYFWGCAVSVAVHIINRTPTKAIPSDKTPFELWHGKRPELKYLRTFGSTAYCHNKTPSGKCEDRAIKGILVGFEPSGYRIYNPKNRKIIVSKDVKFDEIMQNRPAISDECNMQLSNSLAPMQLRSSSKGQIPMNLPAKENAEGSRRIMPVNIPANENAEGSRRVMPVNIPVNGSDVNTRKTEGFRRQMPEQNLSVTLDISQNRENPTTNDLNMLPNLNESTKCAQPTIENISNNETLTQMTSQNVSMIDNSTIEVMNLLPNENMQMIEMTNSLNANKNSPIEISILQDNELPSATNPVDNVNPNSRNKSPETPNEYELTPNNDTDLNEEINNLCENEPTPGTSSLANNLSHKRKNAVDKFLPQPKLRRSNRIQEYQNDIPYLNRLYKDCILIAQSILSVPTSYSDVKNNPDEEEWRISIQSEIDSLLKNETFDIIDRPDNVNVVNCRWVFSIKNDKNGNPAKYKSRLVAKGFTQEYMVDYNETYAPVARIATFRLMLAFANEHNLLVHHMDVTTAFLNGDLDTVIYMKVPPGIKHKPNQVCRLKKAIYGLKQSARCWYDKFDSVIKSFGFKSSYLDCCLYVRKGHTISDTVYIVLYVDDLIIITGNDQQLNLIRDHLTQMFEMKDLDEIELFLGMRITRTDTKISIDQSSYIRTVLAKFNMTDCNPVSIPMENKFNPNNLQSDEYYDAPCRSLLGCLIYISISSRPDIAISVNIISRYIHKNNLQVWKSLKRVLAYLKGTIDLKLTYTRSNGNEQVLEAFADASFANDVDSKSTSGQIFRMYGNAVIDWSAKKQCSVATSTTESEFISLFDCVNKTLYYRELMKSIGLTFNYPFNIYEDNRACVGIANNPNCDSKSAYMRVKYHYMFQVFQNKDLIDVQYIQTDVQLGDALTKPLAIPVFRKHRSAMNLQ